MRKNKKDPQDLKSLALCRTCVSTCACWQSRVSVLGAALHTRAEADQLSPSQLPACCLSDTLHLFLSFVLSLLSSSFLLCPQSFFPRAAFGSHAHRSLSRSPLFPRLPSPALLLPRWLVLPLLISVMSLLRYIFFNLISSLLPSSIPHYLVL